MAKDSTKNVIIIGSGPAGYTAALYTARANLKPLLIEGKTPGGQLATTTEVENYPGFPDGVQGPDLIANMKKQAEKFGTQIITDDVTKLNLKVNPFEIFVGEKKYPSKTIIIATGAGYKHLGLPKEEELTGHGLSYCATCDAYFFKNKDVAVIGGGDAAMEEALFLTKFANKVTVIHRRDQLKASKIMQDRAKENPKICFIWNTVVEDFIGNKTTKLQGLKLKNVNTGETSTFNCQGVFVAIGHEPNTKFLEGLKLDEKGYIITESKSSKTNIEGVFACGDVQDHIYRQAITAAGSGCMAAMNAEKYLENQNK